MKQSTLSLLIGFLFLTPALSLFAQSEVIYEQSDIKGAFFSSEENINLLLGNDIQFVGTNKLLNRIEFTIATSEDVIETNTVFKIHFYDGCPVDPFTPTGSCYQNNLGTYQFEWTPNKNSELPVVLDLPVAINLDAVNLGLNISFSSSQSSEVTLMASDNDPTIGSRFAETISSCGSTSGNSQCEGVAPGGYNNYAFKLYAVANPFPEYPCKFALDLQLSSDGTAIVMPSDIFDFNTDGFEISLSDSIFTCDDLGFPDFTAIVTAPSGATTYCATGNNVPFDNYIPIYVYEPAGSIINSNSPICSGDILELSVTSSAVLPHSYSWAGPADSWLNQNTANPSVIGASSGEYVVSVTSGCGSLNVYNTNIVVNPLPTAMASSYSPTICFNQTLQLTVDVTGVEPFTYAWSGPGQSWYDQDTDEPIVLAPESGDYTVTVTDACGTVTSSTTSVVVIPSSTAIASSNSPLCPGENIELSVETTGEGPFTYNWIGPGHSWGGANTATPTVSGPVSGDYYVTVTGPCETIVASTSVMVEDITPPIANCKNLTIEIIGVNVTLTAEDVNNQSSDECSIQTLLLDGANYVVFDDSDLGLNNLTLTVIDYAGNSSTCESVITVVPDLCPGSDGIDSDNGGLPDDCDCSPNDDFNDKIFLNRDVNVGMDFDGIDDYLSTPNAPLFNPSSTSSISFEAWIKPDTTKESNTIISKGDTAYIFETHYSDLRLFLGSSAGSGTWFTADTQLQPNVWTHVAASYNHTNSTVTFYVNGSFSNTESVSFTIYSADTELFFIGRQGYLCGCNYFKGQMDEVRVWSSDYNSLIRSYKDQELRGGEQSLLAYYSFNDGVPVGNNNNRTITKDYSPNGHHASLSGMAKNGPTSNWVNDDLALAVVNTETLDLCLTCPGGQNGGMDFDGVNSFLEVDRDPVFNPSASSSFTFEAWINPTNIASERTILSKGSGEGGTSSYIFSVISNKLGLYIGDGTFGTWIYSDTNVSGNTWTHVSVVYDHVSNTFTFYKNGIADGIRTITHGFYAGISSVFIGQRGSVGYSKFLGKMDEVRIWKKARTAAEISAYMNKKLYGGEEALSAYYNFDDGIPWGDNTGRSYAADASLNGHEAMLNGFAQTGVTSNWVGGPNNISLPANAAMDFDYLDDYISIANHQSLIPTATNAVTFEAWIFFTPSPNANIISASGNSPNNNHQISIENNKVRVAGTGVSPLLSEQTLDPNAGWTHIAIVFDKTSTKIYINGLLDNTRVQTLAATNLGHPITLGSTVIGDSYYGLMDDVRYWDHARSQDEIQEAMYQELTGKEAGLTSYYNFNNGVASGDNIALTIVPDASDNGLDGTVSGFAGTGSISNWTASPFNFGDLDKDGIPDFCDKCVFEKDIVINDYLWKSVYRASETITLRNDMTLPTNWNLKFETSQLLMSDHIQTATGTEIMVTPFVCDE